MTTSEITYGNSLIAEYMGWKLYTPKYKGFMSLFNKLSELGWGRGYMTEHLKYHSDWNWLMSVVEKIEKENVEIVIDRNECKIQSILSHDYPDCKYVMSYFGHPESTSKIESVWKAVVYYVKNKIN